MDKKSLLAAQETALTVSMEDEDADEMPLLFMDALPSSFQRSAQLAAIAAFMASSDEEGDGGDGDGDSDTSHVNRKQGTDHSGPFEARPPARGKQRRHTGRHTRQRHSGPYARPAVSTADQLKGNDKAGQKRSDGTTGKNNTNTNSTKELQLYLSLFSVSSE